jgi:hypothetical protein
VNKEITDLLKTIGIKTEKERYIKMWLTRKGYRLVVEIAPHNGKIYLYTP